MRRKTKTLATLAEDASRRRRQERERQHPLYGNHLCPRCGGQLTLIAEEVWEYPISKRTGRATRGKRMDTPRSDVICGECDSVVWLTKDGYELARTDLPPLEEAPDASR